jgi:hypothetical protein
VEAGEVVRASVQARKVLEVPAAAAAVDSGAAVVVGLEAPVGAVGQELVEQAQALERAAILAGVLEAAESALVAVGQE